MYDQYIKIAIRWLWLFILVPIVTVGTAFAYNNSQPTIYRAVTRLIVGPGINSPNPDLNSLRAGALLMQTYSELVETESFRQQVVNDTDIDLNTAQLREIIDIRPIIDTQLLNIIVDYTDPDIAIAIVNEIADEMVELSPSAEYNQFLLARIQDQANRIEEDITNTEARLDELYLQLETESDPSKETVLIQRISDEETSLSDANATLARLFETLQSPFTNQVEIVDRADFAIEQSSNLPLTLILAFGAGMIISLGILVLLIFIDSLYVNTYMLKKNRDYPALWGTIRRNAKVETSDLRILSAFLLNQMKDKDIKRVMFTGVDNSKNVAITASDMAIVMSKMGGKILLVDADFTNNTLAERLELTNSVSLVDTLTSGAVGSVKAHEKYPNLYVLPSGELSADAFFLIASERLTRILEHFSKNVDYIIVTTPSLSSFEDSILMAAWTNNAIILLENGRTSVRGLDNAIEYLKSVGSNIMGMIIKE